MLKKTFFLLLVLLSPIAARRAAAQNSFFDNYVYQNWNSFGKLTGATATDIIQTRNGYLNVGTYEGLVIFDGVQFSTIRRARDNDLSFASVRVIFEDSRGNIWIGSNDDGLQKISADGNKCYTTQNGLPNNSVRAICEDKQGNIWIGTAAGVVYLTPKGHLITPQFQAGTVSKGIIAVSLYCDTAGRIWLITANEKGLFLYANELFCTRPELDGFGNYFATAIAQDLKGDFWIALGDKGVVRVRNGNVFPQKTGTILDDTATWSMYVGGDGTIWFGTEKGIAVYNNGAFSVYGASNDLAVAKVNKIISDRENNIWIATDRNGIGKLTHGRFKVTKLGTAANAIAEDADGKLWIGTDNGVYCYDDEVQVTNALTDYTRGLRVRHVAVMECGDVLVSCYTKPAQLRYDQRTGAVTSWTTDNGLIGNKVRVAVETAPNELYVGTTTGLSVIHADGSIRSYRQIDGLENEYVMCIFKDSNDIVWIGTDGGGIYLMKNEVIISHISSEDGLIGNVIFKISQDKAGTYWICTGSGISLCPPFDSAHTMPTSYENINSEQGIGTDSVFQAIPDDDGDIWLTSNYGVASVKRSELLEADARKTLNIRYYSRNDGLDSDGPTSTALSICDRHGRLWFTMVDGFAVYDPVNSRDSSIMPLVHIESVTIDNVETSALASGQRIVLKPGTKRVEIRFTGISFDAPDRIQFTHQLTNFEDEPSLPSYGRTVSYTNMAPGKHTFTVSAINGDGLSSARAETLLFVQKPYLWQMPLFWIVVAVVVIDAIGAVFYLKQRAIRRENARLEEMVKQRTVELAAEKDKSDHLLRAILPEKIAAQLKKQVHSIGENFADVTILFSDIVSFTKTSSGYTAEEIVFALNDLFSLFDERAEKSGVEKIKTIGDSYMAACGLPTPNADHARIMVEFARGMYEDLATYNKTAKIKFNIRIGLNSGPVTAGATGQTPFLYGVWGDSENAASRMESACTPGHIRVSEAVRQHLLESDVQFTEPMECDIKGKGMMTTYEVL